MKYIVILCFLLTHSFAQAEELGHKDDETLGSCSIARGLFLNSDPIVVGSIEIDKSLTASIYQHQHDQQGNVLQVLEGTKNLTAKFTDFGGLHSPSSISLEAQEKRSACHPKHCLPEVLVTFLRIDLRESFTNGLEFISERDGFLNDFFLTSGTIINCKVSKELYDIALKAQN